MASTVLKNLKTMLALKSDKQDDILELIINNTEQAMRFKLDLNSDENFPTELGYIELEVCVRRFNRLKNEGMSSYTQEGESITFNSSDFDDFMDDINRWKQRHSKDVQTLGNLQFFNPYRGDSRADG